MAALGLLAAGHGLLVAAFVTAGCGLLGPGTAWDRPLGDVPGPFEEEGPLGLCLGPVVLDGPARGEDDVGLCIADDLEVAGCEHDGECEGREACVCGRCRVPACRTAQDCPGSLECLVHAHRCQERCVVDGDCAAGQRCDPTTLGCTSACEADRDCPAGEVCSATRGLCITVPCGATPCAPGRTCDVQRRPVVVSRPSPLDGVLWLTVEGTGIVRFVEDGAGWYHASPARAALDPMLLDGQVTAGPGPGLLILAGTADGSAIHAFTSLSGLEWSPLAGDGVILEPGPEWERGWVGRPSAVRDGDGWLVAYEVGPGAGVALARMGTSGDVERLGEGPALLPPDAGRDPHWTGLESCGSPFLFEQDCGGGWSGHALVYEALGLEQIDVMVSGGEPALPNPSVGYARLEEDRGLVVDPANPLHSTTSGVAVTRGESMPALSCDGGRWALLYVASDPSSGLVQGLFRALPY
jgi:hypothetical protein